MIFVGDGLEKRRRHVSAIMHALGFIDHDKNSHLRIGGRKKSAE